MTTHKTFTLQIKADTNDGDYLSTENVISSEELDIVKRMADLIKSCPQRHNYPSDSDMLCRRNEIIAEELYSDKIGESDFAIFNRLVPYGIHTIVSIKVAPAISWEHIL